MKTSILKNKEKTQDLENAMNCARWLVREFENINFSCIAMLFDRAVSDAETWIQTMVEDGALPEGCAQSIQAQEAAKIHTILVRYASIDNPVIREKILERMSESTAVNLDS